METERSKYLKESNVDITKSSGLIPKTWSEEY
jgi:hypothetical protein